MVELWDNLVVEADERQYIFENWRYHNGKGIDR